MSWSVSNVNAYTDPNCPGVVWVLWRATRSTDSAYADTGACFMASYGNVPFCDPDGTPRTLSGGTYTDWPNPTNTTPNATTFGAFVATGLTSTIDPTTVSFTPGLDTDSDALTNVPLTVSDSSVTSAVSMALSGFSAVPYATSGYLEFDTHGPATSIATTVSDATWYGGIQVSSPASGSPFIDEPATFATSDPTVMTITTPYGGAASGNTPDYFILNFLAAGSCNLIVSFPSQAAPNLSQTIPVTVT